MATLYLLLFLAAVSATSAEIDKPNIVFLFADDLGYGDLGAFGHPTSSTPNLDKLALEGLVLTQFYAASPVCSPSRAALLTGRYQTRSGVYPKVFDPDSIGGLPLNETTIAEVLKTVGYSTGIIGKWHLGVGESRQYLPIHQGFDYYMGIPYSHNQCPNTVCFYPNEPCGLKNKRWVPCPLFENDKIIQQPADLLTLTSTYINTATSFIKTKAASGNPFFLYVAFQHTHNPMFAGKQFTNATIRGSFGDSLAELDWGVGEVLDALHEAGIEENTFVFFTTDNGPNLIGGITGGNGGLLRCGKGTTWEGGQRVPAIARWKGRIKPGSRTHQLAATLDILPTLAKITGAELPGVPLDGFDITSVLFEGTESNREYFIYYPNDVNVQANYGIHAVRLHQYKAHYYTQGYLCPDDYYDVVCRKNYTLRSHVPPLLYDLHSDPGELYPLNVTEYKSVMDGINKLKLEFEQGMAWGVSQMERGTSNSSEACARPGCSPFPSCCMTTLAATLTDRSRAIP